MGNAASNDLIDAQDLPILLDATSGLFQSDFVRHYTRNFQETTKQLNPRCLNLSECLNRKIVKDEAREIVINAIRDVLAFAGETFNDALTIEIHRRNYLMARIYQSFRGRSIIGMESQTGMQSVVLKVESPRIQTSESGLRSMTDLIIKLIQLSAKSDKCLFDKILNLSEELLKSLPSLPSRRDNIDISVVMEPLLHYFQGVAQEQNSNFERVTELGLQLAIARGSLSAVLSVVCCLLDDILNSKNGVYRIRREITLLQNYKLCRKHEPEQQQSPCAASHLQHVSQLRESNVESDAESSENVKAEEAVQLIVSELERLLLLPAFHESECMSDSSSEFVFEARQSTFHNLCLLLEMAGGRYFTPKSCPEMLLPLLMDLTISFLQLLTGQLSQVTKLQLSMDAIGMKHECINGLKEWLMRFLKEFPKERNGAGNDLMSQKQFIIMDKASEALSAGLEFLCPKLNQQIQCLVDLLDVGFLEVRLVSDVNGKHVGKSKLIEFLITKTSSADVICKLIKEFGTFDENDRFGLIQLVNISGRQSLSFLKSHDIYSKASSMLLILQRLQTSLFIFTAEQGLSEKQNLESRYELLGLYSKAVLKNLNVLLECIWMKINNFDAANQQPLFQLLSSMNDLFIGQVARPCFAALSALIESSGLNFVNSILTELKPIIPILDVLFAICQRYGWLLIKTTSKIIINNSAGTNMLGWLEDIYQCSLWLYGRCTALVLNLDLPTLPPRPYTDILTAGLVSDYGMHSDCQPSTTPRRKGLTEPVDHDKDADNREWLISQFIKRQPLKKTVFELSRLQDATLCRHLLQLSENIVFVYCLSLLVYHCDLTELFRSYIISRETGSFLSACSEADHIGTQPLLQSIGKSAISFYRQVESDISWKNDSKSGSFLHSYIDKLSFLFQLYPMVFDGRHSTFVKSKRSLDISDICSEMPAVVHQLVTFCQDETISANDVEKILLHRRCLAGFRSACYQDFSTILLSLKSETGIYQLAKHLISDPKSVVENSAASMSNITLNFDRETELNLENCSGQSQFQIRKTLIDCIQFGLQEISEDQRWQDNPCGNPADPIETSEKDFADESFHLKQLADFSAKNFESQQLEASLHCSGSLQSQGREIFHSALETNQELKEQHFSILLFLLSKDCIPKYIPFAMCSFFLQPGDFYSLSNCNLLRYVINSCGFGNSNGPETTWLSVESAYQSEDPYFYWACFRMFLSQITYIVSQNPDDKVCHEMLKAMTSTLICEIRIRKEGKNFDELNSDSGFNQRIIKSPATIHTSQKSNSSLLIQSSNNEFHYEHDFDRNGIIYWLATNAGHDTFRNPALSGLIEVRTSGVLTTSAPASSIVGRTACRCVSRPTANSWFLIDFLGRLIRPNYYTLRHYTTYKVEALRNWQLQGSIDGQSWHVIRNHCNDPALNQKGQSHSWALSANEFYTMFRIYMTGPNSNNSWHLALGGIELYGVLKYPFLQKNVIVPSPHDFQANRISFAQHVPSHSINPWDFWETNTSSDILFSGDVASRPVTITNKSGTHTWQAVRSAQTYASGVHKLRVLVDRSGDTLNTWKIVVGLVPLSFKVDSLVSNCIGGSQGGWGYVAATGFKYHASASQRYGETYASGDIIEIVLDFDNRTITFFRNGISQGVAFRNLNCPVRLAACFTGLDTRLTVLDCCFEPELSQSRWLLQQSPLSHSHSSSGNCLQQLLLSLLQCITPRNAAKALQQFQYPWLALLSELISESSYSIRRICLRIFRTFLSQHADIVNADSKEAKIMIDQLFALLQIYNPNEHLDDVNSIMLSEEIIDVLQKLLTLPIWRESITQKVISNFSSNAVSDSALDRHYVRVQLVSSLLALLGRSTNHIQENRACFVHIHGLVLAPGVIANVSHPDHISVCLTEGKIITISKSEAESCIRYLDWCKVAADALLNIRHSVLQALISFICDKDMCCGISEASRDPIHLLRLKVDALRMLMNLFKEDTWASTAWDSGAFRAISDFIVSSVKYELKKNDILHIERHSSVSYKCSFNRNSDAQLGLSVIMQPESKKNRSRLPNFQALTKFQRKRAGGKRLVRPVPVPLFENPSSNESEFSPFSANNLGILYYLGTNFGLSHYTNPHELSEVCITASSQLPQSHPIHSILNMLLPMAPEATSFSSIASTDEHVVIDFGPRSVKLSAYALRHWKKSDRCALRSWKIEGQPAAAGHVDSNSSWICLRHHFADSSLSKAGCQTTFSIDSSHFYRRIRLTMTAPNSSSSWHLVLGGIELFGWLQDNDGKIISPGNFQVDKASLPTNIDSLFSISRNPNAAIEEHRLFSFGKGDGGRLGQGSTLSVPLPRKVAFLSHRTVRQVSSFGAHCLVLTHQGEVFSFGNGDHGRLGHGDSTPQLNPKQIAAFEAKHFVQVAAGNAFSLALQDNGRIWSWGQGSNGQLADGTISDRHSPIVVEANGLGSVKIEVIGAGGYHSFAISSSGETFAWGKNHAGQLGIGKKTVLQKFPTLVAVPKEASRFVQIVGGWDHTLALTNEGRVYSWGAGYEGRRPVCGHGTNDALLFPKLVQSLCNETVVQIACGWDHSLALSKRGQVYCWGGNNSGSLGNGKSSQHEFLPSRIVHDFERERIVSIDGGQDHSAAITAAGELWTWGSAGPHLGHQDNILSTVPKKVETSGGVIFHSVVCGQKCNFIFSSTRKRICPTCPMAFGCDTTGSNQLPPFPRTLFLVNTASDAIVDGGNEIIGSSTILESSSSCSSLGLHFPISWSSICTKQTKFTVAFRIYPSLLLPISTEVVRIYGQGPSEWVMTVLEHTTNRNAFLIKMKTDLPARSRVVCHEIGLDTSEWHLICIVFEDDQLSVFVNAKKFFHVGLDSNIKDLELSQVCVLKDGYSIRDIACWDYALAASQLENLYITGLTFVESEYREVAASRDCVRIYAVVDRSISEVVVSGLGRASRFSRFQDREFLELRYGEFLQVPRRVEKGTLDGPMIPLPNYTIFMDVCILELNVPIRLFSTDAPGDLCIVILPSGHLAVGHVNSRAVIQTNQWYRLAIQVNLEKEQNIIVCFDGEPVFTIDSEPNDLSSLVINNEFYILDEVRRHESRPYVQISAISIHYSCLDDYGIRNHGAISERCLHDKRSVADLASPLVMMGFPVHWCLKAVSIYGINRFKACEWIVHNQDRLHAEDEQFTFNNEVIRLSQIGYSEDVVSEALKQSANDAQKAISILSEFHCEVKRGVFLRLGDQFACAATPDQKLNPQASLEDHPIASEQAIGLYSLVNYYSQICLLVLCQHIECDSLILRDYFEDGSSFFRLIRASSFSPQGRSYLARILLKEIPKDVLCEGSQKRTVLRLLVEYLTYLGYQLCNEDETDETSSDIFAWLLQTLVSCGLKIQSTEAITKVFPTQVVNATVNVLSRLPIQSITPTLIRVLTFLADNNVDIGLQYCDIVISEPDPKENAVVFNSLQAQVRVASAELISSLQISYAMSLTTAGPDSVLSLQNNTGDAEWVVQAFEAPAVKLWWHTHFLQGYRCFNKKTLICSSYLAEFQEYDQPQALSKQAISDLVLLIEKKYIDPLILDPSDFEISSLDKLQYDSLCAHPIEHIRVQIRLLQEFNQLVNSMIPNMEFANGFYKSRLVEQIIACSDYLFDDSKTRVIRAAADSINSLKQPLLEIDREIVVTTNSSISGLFDDTFKDSAFFQLYSLLSDVDFENFVIPKNSPIWREYLNSQAKLSSIKAKFIEISNEILSCPLFVQDVASNCYAPNPSLTMSYHLALYKFVGCFLGFGSLYGCKITMDLHRLVWKAIVQPVEIPDHDGNKWDIQAQAIRTGLISVIPPITFDLLTWKQFRSTFCGSPHVNLSMLRERTKYMDFESSSPSCLYFWKCLQQFDTNHLQMFFNLISYLEFDALSEHSSLMFTIKNANVSEPDSHLPVGNRNQFTLLLPAYNSMEVANCRIFEWINACSNTR